MKTTDFAMIFIAIILPIVVIVYVDVSFLTKSEEKKLYYINIINSAIDDATYAMKSVEGEDPDLDYGYSGLAEKKVAVNANIAVETFFKSLYDNFEIDGDKTSEEYLKSHVPAMAILDYNGIYSYSIETYETIIDGKKSVQVGHVLKPKRYFSYTYGIKNNKIIPQEELSDIKDTTSLNLYSVIFTMDDYIFFINEDGSKTGFYLEDDKNNTALYSANTNMKDEIIRHLKLQRSSVISSIVSEEMSYSINAHNYYSDIDYQFYFPTIALSDWEQMVNNIGIIAFIQGVNLGNRQLDYVAYGISGLKVTDRYYVTKSKVDGELDYYHVSKECSVYEQQYKPTTGYYLSKVDAASLGYYPCPVCKP